MPRGDVWKTAEGRKRILAGLKKGWTGASRERRLEKLRSPVNIESYREGSKKKWMNPETRARMQSSIANSQRRPDVIAKQKLSHSPSYKNLKSESYLERKVVKFARMKGWIAFKADPLFYVGAPDRLFFLPKGRVVAIEFKRPGKLNWLSAVSKHQQHCHKSLRRLGHAVHVVDSFEAAVEVLRQGACD